jgi:uncharacterized membrane protein YadS
MAVFGVLSQSATKGQSVNFVILIPFSFIGLFLLLFLFTGIALVMDTVFLPGDETPASGAAEIVRGQSPPTSAAMAGHTDQPSVTQPNKISADVFFKKSPVLGTLLLLSVLNWFVFFGVSMYLGGDAVGILPSHDGFVVKSHGHHTPVSESAWVFSLIYSSATLLLTPLIWLLFAAREHGKRWKEAKWPIKLFVAGFLLVWILRWYSSIGRSFLHSLEDWQKLKQSTPALEPSRQAPTIPPNMQK